MRALLSTLCIILALPSILVAGESRMYGSYRHYETLPNVLFLVGKIEDGDSFELRRAMRDFEIDLVVTASPGGSVYEGLQMASIINDKNIATYIPEDANCESSCANIFLGGTKRMALGELGVHQFFSASPDADVQARKDITTAVTQYTTSEIIGILNEFDTPPFVYEKMFATTEIYYLRGAEKQRLGLGTTDSDFLDRVAAVDDFLAVTPKAISRPRSNQITASTTSVATPPSKKPARPSPTPDFDKKFHNTDFFGMDLSNQGLRNVTMLQCENYCKNNPSCAAWSYVHASRWCWPKAGVENISIASNITSGIVDPNRINSDILNRPFIEATALDIPGYDLYPKGLRNMTLDQCRHACQATTNCVAFSYVPKKSWCFPKYGIGQYASQLGVISGVINED